MSRGCRRYLTRLDRWDGGQVNGDVQHGDALQIDSEAESTLAADKINEKEGTDER
jgi:hypothetical protein